MAEEIKQQIADYLTEHRYMALATLGADGKPMVHTLGYTSEGTTVYRATFKESRKIHNIRQNPNVAFVVDEDYRDLGSIKGIQMQGEADVLADPGEIQRGRQSDYGEISPVCQHGSESRHRLFPSEAIKGILHR